ARRRGRGRSTDPGRRTVRSGGGDDRNRRATPAAGLMPTSFRIRTYLALGPLNLARVAAYRGALRLGVHPVIRLRGEAPIGPFFAHPSNGSRPSRLVPRQTWRDEML